MSKSKTKATKKPEAPQPTADMALLTFARDHYLTVTHHHSGHLASRQQGYKISQLCGELGAMLGRLPTVADLTRENFARLRPHLSASYHEHTIRYYCGLFKALLRYAGKLELIEIPDELLPTVTTLELPTDPETADKSLWHICEKDYFPRRLDLRSEQTRKAYRLAINHYGRYLGRAPLLEDLDDDVMICWVKQQLDAVGSVYSVRERLGRLLTLWRWLASRRVVEKFPTITRPEAPELTPTALDQKQLRKLFEAAAQQPGKIDGIPAGHWWQAFLAFVWSTAERRTAALSLRWEWVNFDRSVIVIPAKSRKGKRKPGVYPLWPEVASLLQRIAEPKRELVFPWPYSDGSYYGHFGQIAERAGLPDDSKHKTHCIRCSHASWLTAFGGNATAALGHSSAETTARHYIDQWIMPPEERRLFVPWS